MLDRNVDVLPLNINHQSLLHILLGHTVQNIQNLTQLCKRVIDKGVNINIFDKYRVVALKFILAMKYTDAELSPLYDLWFSQPYVELGARDKWGLTPMEFAKKIPYRVSIVKRMMEYGNQ